MKEQDKDKVKTALIITVLLVGAAQMGWLTYFGIEPFKFGIDPLVDADDVYFKIQVKESLGAMASEDIIVNAYDADGITYLGSATASSGLATFSGFSVKEGQSVWVQGRQAAPASADGYITPLTEFIVGQGDPSDTVSAKQRDGSSILFVSNLHDSTEPIFAFYAPDGQDLVSGTADNLTTADLYFSMTIRISDDECNYGAPDFVDRVTGEEYIGGIWVVWRGTNAYDFEQGSARHHISWSDPTYTYNAWNYDTRLWQDSLQTGDVNVFTAIMTLANGADFDQGAETLQLDVFDMMLVTGTTYGIGNFVDGGALAPAAVAAYID